jgi:DNA-binding SARP family transcriptional activator
VGEYEFRLLGPVEVLRRGAQLPVEAPRQRALMASLLLEPNRVVSVERLTSQLWGADPPARARNTIQSLVLRLRRALPPRPSGGLVQTRPSGYRMGVEAGELDLDRFDAFSAQGRHLLGEGQAGAAATALRAALDLWRGEPLAGAAGARLQEVDAACLREKRLQALEDRVEADLMLGRCSELLHELPAIIAEHPLRERLYAWLMIALHREGRQAEAFEHFRILRRRLVDELAVEPADFVQELHRQMLAGDPVRQPWLRSRAPLGRRGAA